MNFYFITGTSKGIGKAICSKLLEEESNRIIGISRTKSIEHPHYRHINFDLSKTDMISQIVEDFYRVECIAEKVVLINNAAFLGDVGPFGKLSNKSLINLYNINIIAPAILMNSFIKRFKKAESEKIIINISSGAAMRPMDGWGGYCSSKAAINMMSEVAALENELQKDDFKIYALAPGVVDTEMQSEIRKADKEDFSDIERFKKLKKNGELSDPLDTAEKILYLIQNANKYKSVIQDVRKF